MRAAVAISVAAICLSARAQTPGFWFVPVQAGQHLNHPAALSRDGSVLVGTVEYDSGAGDAFRWTRSGGREVYNDGPSVSMDPHGVSTNGTVSAGVWADSSVTNSARPYRQVWGNMPDLIPLPTGFTYGEARGLSDDGNVVVGNWMRVFLGNTTRQPFVWTPSGGTVLIGQLSSQNEAIAISRDGSTVVGVVASGVGFDWTQAGGYHVLSPPPVPNITWGASAVSTAGAIIAGTYSATGGGGTIRWINGVPQDLGHLPGFAALSPIGVSDDGSVIAGDANGPPMIWSESLGFVGATDYFSMHGASLPPGLTLYRLTSMTPDGLTFAGYATLNGIDGACVVTIPAPPIFATLVLGMGIVAARRRR